MEEFDLLKERLQAITDKHHIQEDIRQKKLELDQEKLKLQHLKKKSLREQWLLQDSASHNATDSPQQQSLDARQLQLSIHRIEMEVESLERQESIISTNESCILNRLRAVEKSSEDIIKEVQDSFVPEPLQVPTGIPEVPECISPPANTHSEPNTPRKTLFAMEINVSKNLSTGESTVLSTATVPPEELNQRSGLKVYDDGRKCVYAFNSKKESLDQRYMSELSANEVQQLLRSATAHRQAEHQNYRQPHCRSKEIWFYRNHDEGAGVEGGDLRHQRRLHGNHLLTNITEKDMSCRDQWPRKPGVEHHYGHQDSQYRRQEVRNNQSNLREAHCLGSYNGLGHYSGKQKDGPCILYPVRNCVQEDLPSSRHTNTIIRSNSMVNGGRANRSPLPRSHDQEVVSDHQPQLCYTPASYIPLRDYVSVDEDQLYSSSPLSYHSHDVNPSPALCSGSAHSDRVPSPLYGDDTPYTILNAIDTTESITAVFMGFQTAQDDSGRCQEFEGSLKAELVIIEDNDDNDNSVKEKKSYSYPTEGWMEGGRVEGGRRTERRVGPGTEEEERKRRAHPSDM